MYDEQPLSVGNISTILGGPDTYSQVEYLRSTGEGQQIDTGLFTTGSTRIVMRVIITKDDEDFSNGRIGSMFFGSQYPNYGHPGVECFLWLTGGSNEHALNARYNSTLLSGTTEYKIGDRLDIDFNKNTVTVKKVETGEILDSIVFTIQSIKSSGTLKLFSLSRNDNYYGDFIMESCVIYENGEKIRDYVPCLDGTSNEYGLYDLVNCVFYGNSNKGSFQGGGFVKVLRSNIEEDTKSASVEYIAQILDPDSTLEDKRMICFSNLKAIQNIDIPGYQRLRYIESDGKEWIDTEYYSTGDSRIEMHAIPLTTKASQVGAFFFGSAYPTSYDAGCEAYVWNYIEAAYNSQFISVIQANARVPLDPFDNLYIDFDKNTILFKDYGTQKVFCVCTFSKQTFTSSETLKLFSLNRQNPNYFGKIRMYYCNIFENGTPVRKFLPVKRLTDNVAGMYDRIGNKFYPSKSQHQFFPGPVVSLARNYEELSYIYFNGTQFINTLIKPTNATRVVIHLNIDTIQKQSIVAIFGGRTITDSGVFVDSFTLWIQNGQYVFQYGTYAKTITNITPNGHVTIDWNKQSVTIETNSSSTVVNLNSQTFQAEHEMRIAANYTTSNGFHDGNYNDNRRFSGKFYYMKIYDNDVLIRDFHPAKRFSDNAVGLYDSLNKIFYEKGGGNDFGEGSKVNYL